MCVLTLFIYHFHTEGINKCRSPLLSELLVLPSITRLQEEMIASLHKESQSPTNVRHVDLSTLLRAWDGAKMWRWCLVIWD